MFGSLLTARQCNVSRCTMLPRALNACIGGALSYKMLLALNISVLVPD